MGMIHIRSGEWSNLDGVIDYRAEKIGEYLVERAVQTREPDPTRTDPPDPIRRGIGYRFWQPKRRLLIDRHFTMEGRTVCTCAYTVIDLRCDESDCTATVGPLRVWIGGDGIVVLRGESDFERDVRTGIFPRDQVASIEGTLREVTAGIARGTYPPAMIRRWRIDVEQIRRQLATAHGSGSTSAQ